MYYVLNGQRIERALLIDENGHCSIPEGVTEISGNEIPNESIYSVFGDCETSRKLKSVTIPNSMKVIGACAFNGCKNLHQVTIPASVITLDNAAFGHCTELNQIKFSKSSSLKKVGIATFHHNYSLQSIEFPDNIEEIGTYAFGACVNLRHVILPKNLKKMGERVFSRCYNLREVMIPDGVIDIGNALFEGERSLKMVVLPNKFKDDRNRFGIGAAAHTVIYSDFDNSNSLCFGSGMHSDYKAEEIHINQMMSDYYQNVVQRDFKQQYEKLNGEVLEEKTESRAYTEEQIKELSRKIDCLKHDIEKGDADGKEVVERMERFEKQVSEVSEGVSLKAECINSKIDTVNISFDKFKNEVARKNTEMLNYYQSVVQRDFKQQYEKLNGEVLEVKTESKAYTEEQIKELARKIDCLKHDIEKGDADGKEVAKRMERLEKRVSEVSEGASLKAACINSKIDAVNISLDKFKKEATQKNTDMNGRIMRLSEKVIADFEAHNKRTEVIENRISRIEKNNKETNINSKVVDKFNAETKARAEAEKMLKSQIAAVEEKLKAQTAARAEAEKMLKEQIAAVEERLKQVSEAKAETEEKLKTQAEARTEAEEMLKEQIAALEAKFEAFSAAKAEEKSKAAAEAKTPVADEKSEVPTDEKILIDKYNASKEAKLFDRNVLNYEHEHCENKMVCRIPEWAEYIASGTATAEDDWIEKLIIGRNVSVICNDAFNGCPKIDWIDFSEAVALETIEENAFAGCGKLRRVNVPENCEIEDGAFPEKCKVKRANTKSTNVSYSLVAPAVTKSMREKLDLKTLNDVSLFGNDILREDISVISKTPISNMSRYGQSSMATAPLGDSTIRDKNGDNFM